VTIQAAEPRSWAQDLSRIEANSTSEMSVALGPMLRPDPALRKHAAEAP